MQHQNCGFTGVLVLTEHGAFSQRDHRLAQNLLMPAVDSSGTVAPWGGQRLLGQLASQCVQRGFLHPASMASARRLPDEVGPVVLPGVVAVSTTLVLVLLTALGAGES